MMSLGVHLRIIGRPGRIGALERFLQHVQGAGSRVWIARRRDIASYYESLDPAARALPRAQTRTS